MRHEVEVEFFGQVFRDVGRSLHQRPDRRGLTIEPMQARQMRAEMTSQHDHAAVLVPKILDMLKSVYIESFGEFFDRCPLESAIAPDSETTYRRPAGTRGGCSNGPSSSRRRFQARVHSRRRGGQSRSVKRPSPTAKRSNRGADHAAERQEAVVKQRFPTEKMSKIHKRTSPRGYETAEVDCDGSCSSWARR